MAPRTLTFPFAWLFVSAVCMNAAYTSAWGTYVCDIQDKGLQKIREVCSGAATDVQSPLSVLEKKIERVLEFVEEIKIAEDSWLHLSSKKSGTVERDLSRHEESDRRDIDRRGQSDRDRSSKETKDDRETHEDEPTRVEEDRRSRGRDRSYDGRDWRDRETDTYDRRDRERDTYDRRGRDRDTYDRRDRERDYDRRDRESDAYDRRDREQDTYDRRDREWRSRRERTSDDDREEEGRQRAGEGEEDKEKSDEKKEEPEKGEDDTRIDIRRKPQDKGHGNEPQKGECKAIVIDNHETIGMFYMMSYQHGHCANRNPIVEPIRYCLGYCTTKTFIDREAGIWSQGSDCKSCQPMQFETIKIPLTCDDGFSFDKKFENVVDCKCQGCKSAIDG